MRAEVDPRWSSQRLGGDPGKYPSVWVIVGASGCVEDMFDRACAEQTGVDSGAA
jgi:hypothetical protein